MDKFTKSVRLDENCVKGVLTVLSGARPRLSGFGMEKQ